MNENTVALLLNPQENYEWYPETDEDYETRDEVVKFYRQVVARLVDHVYEGNVEEAHLDFFNCYRQEDNCGGDFNNTFAAAYGLELLEQGLTDEVVWVPLLDTLCAYEQLCYNDRTELNEIFF